MRGSVLLFASNKLPLVGDGSRLQGTAIGLGNDKSVVRQRNAKLEKLLGLLDPMAAQLVHHPRRQRHRAPLPALGLLITDTCCGLFGALGHRELGRAEIDVAPAQSRDLAAA